MVWRNDKTHWGLIAQLFHWGMFILILGAWYAVEAHEDFPKGSDERAQWMMIHKALGVSIFFLAWMRIAARLSQVTPSGVGAAWQQKLANGVHLGLYAVMIGMPMTGMLASQFAGRTVSWFGVFEIPVVLEASKSTAGLLMEMHEAGFAVLMLLLIAHVGAAIYHRVVLKDGVLERMLPWGRK